MTSVKKYISVTNYIFATVIGSVTWVRRGLEPIDVIVTEPSDLIVNTAGLEKRGGENIIVHRSLWQGSPLYGGRTCGSRVGYQGLIYARRGMLHMQALHYLCNPEVEQERKRCWNEFSDGA